MRQWRAFKKQHPDCVLFFRMGDFYECFGADAERLAPALGLTLTKRGSPIPMAGVPHHQKDRYLRDAIRQGFRVAVCDQIQDPKDAKGVVDRAVTQVVTPGTLVDEGLLPGDDAARLAGVAFTDQDRAGAAVVELSTGALEVIDTDPSSLADELARRRVGEILWCAADDDSTPERIERLLRATGASGTPRASWHFRPDEAAEAVRTHYAVATLAGLGIQDADPSTWALGVVLRYLAETQAVGRTPARATSGSDNQSRPVTLAHVGPPRREDRSGLCRLDATSLRALEVDRTIQSGAIDGSLLGVFLAGQTGPRCVMRTPMGRRLIREWLCAPLSDVAAIQDRQGAVATLVDDPTLAAALGERLDDVADVARIAGRLALGRATPRDLVGLGVSLGQLGAVVDVLRQADAFGRHRAALLGVADALAPVARAIAERCVDSPPAHLREGGLIRDGVDPELDEARSLHRDAGQWLARYQTRLVGAYDLPSLKVGYNKVFGYYIELPSAQARRAPPELTRKQTLKNAERYITPELKEFENKVTSAEARALDRERALFDDLCAQAAGVVGAVTLFAETIAELDVLAGLASKAKHRGWVRPEITGEPVLDIHAGRHPVLDELLESGFVPNDCALGTASDPAGLALITGPNMAGKSTYIRQTALLCLLASVGSFVPADGATIGVCDRIFTRVGADDAIHRGQSTFMVEMIETAGILNHATPRSLVVLDEIGRGTSTLDGLSLAWAVTEYLATRGDARAGDAPPGPRTLFATHYHELTDLEDRLPGRVRNLHVAVREWNDEAGRPGVVFLHQIRPGRTDRSYGIHVARLAGVPDAVTDRADELLEALSVEHARQADAVRTAPAGPTDDQLGLFTQYLDHPVVERLREVKLDALTPLQAFDLLRTLRQEADTTP